MTDAQNPTTPSMPEAPKTSGGQNTVMAILAYILFFIPLLTGDAKKDPFVKYHTKQGLTLFILVVLLNIVGSVMPYFSLWMLINSLLNLGTLVLLVIGIKNVLDKKEVPLPFIGQYADRFKF